MINGTLFIQIFHFFCAYYLFKKILLESFLVVIEQEEHEKKRLNFEIVQLKNKTVQLFEYKQELWQECLKKISAIRPSLIIRYSADQKEEDFQYKEASFEQKKEYVHILAKLITDQLIHENKQGE